MCRKPIPFSNLSTDEVLRCIWRDRTVLTRRRLVFEGPLFRRSVAIHYFIYYLLYRVAEENATNCGTVYSR